VAIMTAFPGGRGGNGGFVNQATITIGLPRRLLVHVEPHIGQLSIRDIAGVEVIGSRGDTRVTGSTGHVILSHTGGDLEVDGVPSLKLTARNSHGSIKHVAGMLSLDATNAELDLEDIAGPVDVEARNTELEVEASKTVKVPVRFNGTGGRLRVKELRAEARIDGRNVELDIAMASAAPVTIYSTGEDISVTPPPGGYALDAVATEGRVSVDDGGLKAPEEGAEQRVTGTVRGGGAALTLRATRADIRLRKPEGQYPIFSVSYAGGFRLRQGYVGRAEVAAASRAVRSYNSRLRHRSNRQRQLRNS
jgi:hypothetical protein